MLAGCEHDCRHVTVLGTAQMAQLQACELSQEAVCNCAVQLAETLCQSYPASSTWPPHVVFLLLVTGLPIRLAQVVCQQPLCH